MNALRWVLSLMVYAAMVGLCIIQFQYAGLAGLAGAVVGFLVRFAVPGQSDMGERLGNGYVGSLTGLFLGYAAIGFGQYVYANFGDWVEFIVGVAS